MSCKLPAPGLRDIDKKGIFLYSTLPVSREIFMDFVILQNSLMAFELEVTWKRRSSFQPVIKEGFSTTLALLR